EQCSQQDREVVAIAGTQLQHLARGVQRLHSKDVAGIADIPSHPIVDRTNFPQAILGHHAVAAKDIDGLLPHTEIFGAAADQVGDHARGDQRAWAPFRYAHDPDSRLTKSPACPSHSQDPSYLSHGHDHWFIKSVYGYHRIGFTLVAAIGEVQHSALQDVVAIER